MEKVNYSKPYLDVTEQLDLLVNRGLIIEKKEVAHTFLKRVNYYRLSAYFIPFELERHKFKNNTSFEEIVGLYNFDKTLRNLIFKALETVEILLKTKTAYKLAQNYGMFGHVNQNVYKTSKDFNKLRAKIHQQIGDSNEPFVKHFEKTYEEYPNLPIWAEVEIYSFGTLSHFLTNIENKITKDIFSDFSMPTKVLLSWIHFFVYIRNICAHHSRLWNRELRILPILPKKLPFLKVAINSSKRTWLIIVTTLFLLKEGEVDILTIEKWLECFKANIKLVQSKVKGINIIKSMEMPDNWEEVLEKLINNC